MGKVRINATGSYEDVKAFTNSFVSDKRFFVDSTTRNPSKAGQGSECRADIEFTNPDLTEDRSEVAGIRLIASREFVDSFIEHITQKEKEGIIQVTHISDSFPNTRSTIERHFGIRLGTLKDLLTSA